MNIRREKLWPNELLYWRLMTTAQIQEYCTNVPEEKRLILVVWGVIESHGAVLPTASDQLTSAVVTDAVAMRLYREKGIQPIILDIFKDIGAPSATWEYPGSLGYASHPVSVIPSIWVQTLRRLFDDGFTNVYLVNGDGGNWQSHWAQLKWLPEINELLAKGMKFEGSNWDQDGRLPGIHGGTLAMAIQKWMADLAPEEIRLSALRHGLLGPDESRLPKEAHDNSEFEKPPLVHTYWARHPKQKYRLGMLDFNPKWYKELLSGKSDPTLESEIEYLIGTVYERVLAMMDSK